MGWQIDGDSEFIVMFRNPRLQIQEYEKKSEEQKEKRQDKKSGNKKS
ncbi:Protein CBG27168 [Caenorhabditis briggsae]|uniref:Protein CBG27168 n=1 Tax=Caenorhabditis briggsae TaxID=6238 RepID=B6IL77_CAEBR|nr:Protein CBG27168 [Caenorhabditis briggsae]CAS00630.1 Protein CBG27168 [Caenorhabditis briggsae]